MEAVAAWKKAVAVLPAFMTQEEIASMMEDEDGAALDDGSDATGTNGDDDDDCSEATHVADAGHTGKADDDNEEEAMKE